MKYHFRRYDDNRTNTNGRVWMVRYECYHIYIAYDMDRNSIRKRIKLKERSYTIKITKSEKEGLFEIRGIMIYASSKEEALNKWLSR